MKTQTLLLVLALIVGASVELKTDRTTPVQPGRSRPLETAYVVEPIPFSAVHHQQSGIPRVRLWESTSANWSGYAVPSDESSKSDTFSEVEGTWVIPTVTGATKRSTTYSAVWVGLDGYSSDTVEQIGTEHDWIRGKQQNYVWFEMYPSGAYRINNFPADPGDSISAQVVYVGPTQVQVGRGRNKTMVDASVFQLTIVNNSQNVSYTVPSSYTTTTSAERSSAEWVVEAPSSSSSILPLADFGTVSFSECYATGSSGALSPIDNWKFDPMTMADPSGGGAVPSDLTPDGTSFTVQWTDQ